MPAKKGVPHKKLSIKKQAEAAQRTIELLSNGTPNGEVKRVISKEFGIKPRSVEPYIRRAREELRSVVGQSIEDLRAQSYRFYTSVLNDPEASHSDKIKAQQSIDKLLGLPKPIMIHNKNTNLELTPEQIQEMTDDELADLQSRITNSD